MSDLLEKGFKAQAQSLREFGYPDVTAKMVKSAHEDWVAGKPAKGVVAMFCVSAFEEHPQIFEQPA